MLDKRSIELRRKILQIISSSRRGHIGSAFSIVEILRVLYDDILRINPQDPLWKDRDRFILSKGHGCLALYVLLAEKGFFPKEELSKFCQFEGILGGHPELYKIPGIEASTGSLGHGLSIAIGFALAASLDSKKYKTYVLLGDGECDEGSIWEAAMCAGKHKLSNLIVLVDYNKMQSYGSVFEVQNLEPFADKWRSFNFDVQEVDGHSISALYKSIRKTLITCDKPHVIICHTVKGKGISSMEQIAAWHHKNMLSDEDMQRLYKELETTK